MFREGGYEQGAELLQERQTREYRDKNGELIGVVEVAYDGEAVALSSLGEVYGGCQTVDGERPGKARRLSRFVIKGTDGEVDVLAMYATKTVGVYEATEPLDNYCHASGGTIFPPLVAETDVGVAFHELGHSYQNTDPRFKKLSELGKYGRAEFWEQVLEVSGQIGTTFLTVLQKLSEFSPDIARMLEGTSYVKDAEQLYFAESDFLKKNFALKKEMQKMHHELFQRIVKEYFQERLGKTPQLALDELLTGTYSKDEKEVKDTILALLENAGILALNEGSFEKTDVDGEKQSPVLTRRVVEGWELDDVVGLLQCISGMETQYGKKIHTFSIDGVEDRHADAVMHVSVPYRIAKDDVERNIQLVVKLDQAEAHRIAFEKQRATLHTTRAMLNVELIDGKSLEKKRHALRVAYADVFQFATRILERDATARAYVMLRQIRDATGADFLKSGHIQDFLSEALDTYVAGNKEMRAIYGGHVPKPDGGRWSKKKKGDEEKDVVI